MLLGSWKQAGTGKQAGIRQIPFLTRPCTPLPPRGPVEESELYPSKAKLHGLRRTFHSFRDLQHQHQHRQAGLFIRAMPTRTPSCFALIPLHAVFEAANPACRPLGLRWI